MSLSCDKPTDRRSLLEQFEEYRSLPQDVVSSIFPNKNTDFVDLIVEENYHKNSLNEALFLQKIFKKKYSNQAPASSEKKVAEKPKAIVFSIHGFGSSVVSGIELVSKMFAQEDFIVYAMDGYGHGRSDGLHAYIDNFEKYVKDYQEIYGRVAKDHPDQKKFLLSVSMGGSVAFEMLRKDTKNIFSGSIFMSPLIKLSPSKMPSSLVVSALSVVSVLLPTWKLTPVSDIDNQIYNKKELGQLFRKNPIFYSDRSRLRTSFELLKFCNNSERVFGEINQSVFILHGDEDLVTCPQASKELYDGVSSKDKLFKLYKGQKHGLILDDKAEEVLDDIFSWLKMRL